MKLGIFILFVLGASLALAEPSVIVTGSKKTFHICDGTFSRADFSSANRGCSGSKSQWEVNEKVCVFQAADAKEKVTLADPKSVRVCGTVVKTDGALADVKVTAASKKWLSEGDSVRVAKTPSGRPGRADILDPTAYAVAALGRLSGGPYGAADSGGKESTGAHGPSVEISAGAQMGTTYFFPIGNLQVRLLKNLYVGGTFTYLNASSGNQTLSGIGFGLMISYYFERLLVPGIWTRVGGGMFNMTVTDTTVKTGSPMFGTGVLGWGTAFKMGREGNVQLAVRGAVGALYVSSESQSLGLDFSGVLPTFIVEIGLGF